MFNSNLKFDLIQRKILKYYYKNKNKNKNKVDYTYEILSNHDILGESNLDSIFNLVGDNWINNELDKPIIILWGFNDWKWGFVSDYLKEYRTVFAPRKFKPLSALKSLAKFPFEINGFFVWGFNEPYWLKAYAKVKSINISRVEDGFVRSAALGATHSTPYSLVIDSVGLYIDPRKPSELENILNYNDFDEHELRNANECISLLKKIKISKYNQPGLNVKSEARVKFKKHVAILGQVDTDMSIKLGNVDKWTVLDIINLAKLENPDAELFYRPHPEVYKIYQSDSKKKKSIEKICQVVSPYVPLLDFLDDIDHVYTITSLSGLEAIFLGKKVTVMGAAFYAGWGLTDDRCIIKRRYRKRTVQELFCAVYFNYSKYLANLDNSVLGLKSAIYRIDADRTILKHKEIKNNIANKDFDSRLKNRFWMQYYLREDVSERIDAKTVSTINFGKWFLDYGQSIFCKNFIYLVFPCLEDDAARGEFLGVVQKYIDIDSFNDVISLISKYFNGDYILKQISDVCCKNGDLISSISILSKTLKSVSRQENNRIISINLDEGAEDFDFDSIDINNKNHLNILYDILVKYFDSKKYEEFFVFASILLLGRYKINSIIIMLAKISEIRFEEKSALGFARISQEIDLFAHNRQALSLEVSVLNEVVEDDEIINAVRKNILGLTLNPERINNALNFSKNLGEKNDFNEMVTGVLNLDKSHSFNKVMAYLELGMPEKSLNILNIISKGSYRYDKFATLYSKTLCALGLYKEACDVAEKSFEECMNEATAREFIRILAYLGKFERALKVAEIARLHRVEISPSVLLPLYLGVGEIEVGYKKYLEIPFRVDLINIFGEKYKREQEVFRNGLLMAVYGPGDEIRFASLYNDFAREYGFDKFKITCDHRLLNLFSRSFPDIEFIPVKRVRDFSINYPRSLYNKIPSSELISVMDNDLINRIDEFDKIVMVTDLIWEFRKRRSDFPAGGYLVADQNLVENFKIKFDKGVKYVGINWRSSINSFSRRDHYLDVEDLKEIWSIPGVKFVNLQYDECSEELDWVNKNFPGKLINFPDVDQYNDFDSVAALMQSLDLVIAPCTSVVELAGALGCKTWMLSNSSELHWRRGCDEINYSDIWHKSIRHIEAQPVGDKSSLVSVLKNNLINFLKL